MMSAKKQTNKNGKNCFVIAPIGDKETDIRTRSDLIYKHVISPPLNECGYKSIRADKISEPGIITSQIIQHIAEDQMVIADLTGRNANVFYELAIRHALRKPVVQIIGKGEKIPFDVAATRIITLDHTDLDNVEDAKKEIIKQIKASEKTSFEPESPITVAVQLQSLLSSNKPESKRFGDILSAIQEVQKSVLKCERKLSRPNEILPPSYMMDILEHTGRGRLPPGIINDLDMLTERMHYMMRKKGKKLSAKESDIFMGEFYRLLEEMRYRIKKFM